jgi:hypothetical protein
MISYIIPTIWKSDNIYKTISRFTNSISDKQAELIIIDNTCSGYTSEDERVRVFKMIPNQFVNPSWQIGVDNAVNNKICIVNDDIIFNISKFHRFILDTDAKAVCMTNHNKINQDEVDWLLKTIDNPHSRPAGAGQLMLFEKQNWFKLPYELKLWHGDDIIYYYHTLVRNIPFNYIEGMAVLGDQSQSVNSMPSEMVDIFTQDTLEYYKVMHTLGLECCTIFPMELKSAWKYGDIQSKLKFEKLLNTTING